MDTNLKPELKKLILNYGMKKVLHTLIDIVIELGDEDYIHKLTAGLTTTLIEYENRYVTHTYLDEEG